MHIWWMDADRSLSGSIDSSSILIASLLLGRWFEVWFHLRYVKLRLCKNVSLHRFAFVRTFRTDGRMARSLHDKIALLLRWLDIILFFFVFFLFGFRFYLLKCHNRCFTCFMMNMIDAWWQHLLKSPFVRLHVYLLLYLHSMFAALARPFNKNKTRAELLWRRREKKNHNHHA